MWLVNCLCITSFIFALLFYPVLSQIATNDSDAQKSKRSPLAPFGLGNSPAPGDTSSINWRLSLGNINTTHVDFAPTASRSVKQHFRNKASWRPEVRIIGDNLAVNLSWPSRNSQQRQLSHYRIQFRYREPHERRWDQPFVVVQTRLSGRAREPYMYVTNKQPGGLEAGKVYQFQVVAVYVDAQAAEEKSRWSATISFDYISPEPPLVRVARRLPDGAVHIKWSRPWRQSDFKITRFIILFRKEKRLPGGETTFHGFQHITALGNLEEYKVTRLDRSAGYQFVVYGENTPKGVDPSKALFTGGLNGRRITAFSQEVFVPMAVRATATKEFDGGVSGGSGGSSSTFNNPPSLLDMNTTSSNSLMFLILGVLAGAMLIVMTFLVAICFFRQRKEKLRLLAQVNDKDIRLVAGSPGASGGSNEMARGGGGSESVGSKAVAPKGGTGFLLSELTPIAVANFRTASPQLTSVAEERESLLLPPPQPPPPPPPPFSVCESCPSGSSTTAPSEFNVAVMEMKREPPSGGSIHEESDDDTAKHPKDTVGASTPPSTHKSVFFTQIPFHLRGYPLRNFHLHRRPPSPALGSGSGLQRSSRGHPHDCSHDELAGWRLAAEASGARLSRLGSRTFAYPSSITSADDWLAGQYACSTPTHFPHLTSRGLSPPPQRIQAIVPQVDRNEVKGEVEELKISQNLRGSVEASSAHNAKSRSTGASVTSPLDPLHLPRRKGSLGLRGHIHSLAASTVANHMSEQLEQADAYTQTLANNDGGGSGVGAISHGNSGQYSFSPVVNASSREMDVNFVLPSSSSAVAALPAADSRTDSTSHQA
ncbi:cell adhesion molecule:down regulated by [Echinococcus multilocularis]|uniref:Cell adhesion molecule:down regulated by n=1 Tax=Echinococcus multilocularis TaxID=6211 RepID=A0A068YE27_ECHMU|nr:cell adhesion molecule:down regulated by [Echinococcus multilocularis]